MCRRILFVMLLFVAAEALCAGAVRRVPSEYATIQAAIDASADGDEVTVEPNVYVEQLNFLGRAITVRSEGGAAVIDGDDDFAVSFFNGEGPGSVLENFVITNSYMGIFAAGTFPTIRNVTVVNNRYGAGAYVDGVPDIRSSIFWNNSEQDLVDCVAQYSCIEDANDGQGNISADPLFVDANAGDYHLLSNRGRYLPALDLWVVDEVTSPCIAAGDPMGDFSAERTPNGGRINMGAYGGTGLASMSEWEIDGDMDFDGTVDFNDFSIFADNWMCTSERAYETWSRSVCAANLSAIGKACLLYANDNEEEYPEPNKWCDLLVMYADVEPNQLRCPGGQGGPGHYAINPNAGVSLSPEMVLLFETTAGWNQFGGPEIMTTENHRGDGCNIVFNDCYHVEFVPKERFGELIWE